MEYSLEMCSLYDKKEINTTPVIVFSDHNMALPVWGTYANKFNKPLRLISLDYHADTHDPFATKVGVHDFDYKKFERTVLNNTSWRIDNFCFEDVYNIACEYVANDEHILTAYQFDYISDYHLFCALPDDEINGYQRYDQRRGLSAFYYAKSSIKNMSYEELCKMSEVPFILDFDLDYFTNPQIFDDLFIDKISFLIKKATLITIAREPKYFELEKLDASFENSQALELLLNVIQKALN